MKREKKLFNLPSLTNVGGKELSINDLNDIDSGFKTCDSGCDDGCSSGVGSSYKGSPGPLGGSCKACLE